MARQRRMRGYQMAAKLFLTWKEFAGYAREFGHTFTSAQNSLPQDEALALIEKVQHVRELLQQQPKQIFEQTSTTGSYELLRGYPISWDVEAVNVDTPGQTTWQKSTKIEDVPTHEVQRKTGANDCFADAEHTETPTLLRFEETATLPTQPTPTHEVQRKTSGWTAFYQAFQDRA